MPALTPDAILESPHDGPLLRILDASANRASEGLRSLEEYARFVLEDRLLTAEAKAIRHELHSGLQAVPSGALLGARAVGSDPGTSLATAAEGRRDDLLAVVGSAAARSQQALRCIEEYAKPLGGELARRAELLRYRTYTLAAALLMMDQRHRRLQTAKLYLLMPADCDDDRFAERVRGLYQAGVDIIQLRDKQADDAHVYRLSRLGAGIARSLGKWFIINDRADIALASGAQGVHVGQQELPVQAVRRVVGGDLLVGVSTHDLDQLRRAVFDGADYVGCGPTFRSRTKSLERLAGIEFLRQAADACTLPAFAIGGIDLENLDAVVASGIHGIAVSQAIVAAEDPAAAATQLKQRLTLSPPPPRH